MYICMYIYIYVCMYMYIDNILTAYIYIYFLLIYLIIDLSIYLFYSVTLIIYLWICKHAWDMNGKTKGNNGRNQEPNVASQTKLPEVVGSSTCTCPPSNGRVQPLFHVDEKTASKTSQD